VTWGAEAGSGEKRVRSSAMSGSRPARLGSARNSALKHEADFVAASWKAALAAGA